MDTTQTNQGLNERRGKAISAGVASAQAGYAASAEGARGGSGARAQGRPRRSDAVDVPRCGDCGGRRVMIATIPGSDFPSPPRLTPPLRIREAA